MLLKACPQALISNLMLICNNQLLFQKSKLLHRVFLVIFTSRKANYQLVLHMFIILTLIATFAISFQRFFFFQTLYVFHLVKVFFHLKTFSTGIPKIKKPCIMGKSYTRLLNKFLSTIDCLQVRSLQIVRLLSNFTSLVSLPFFIGWAVARCPYPKRLNYSNLMTHKHGKATSNV